MNTASYAARRATAVASLTEWARTFGADEQTLSRLSGQVGNHPPLIKELFLLEEMVKFVTTRNWHGDTTLLLETTGDGEFTGLAVPDLSEMTVDQLREYMKENELTRPQLLAMIGQELSAEEPRKTVVNALEGAFIKAEPAPPQVDIKEEEDSEIPPTKVPEGPKGEEKESKKK